MVAFGQTLDVFVHTCHFGHLLHTRAVVVVDVAESYVLLGSAIETDIVLKYCPNAMTQSLQVVLAHVDTVHQYGSLVGIVEAEQQFEQGGLSETVLALYLCHLAGTGCEVEMAQHIAFHLRVAESDVAELDTLHLQGERLRIGRVDNGGLEVEELEEVADEEAVVVKSRHTAHQLCQLCLSATEGLEQHHERTHGDGAVGGAHYKEHGYKEQRSRLDNGTNRIVPAQAAGDLYQVFH